MDAVEYIATVMTMPEEELAALIAEADAVLEVQCTLMFCIGDRDHAGSHYDATGYSWDATAPNRPVIAHVYTASSPSPAAGTRTV